MAEMWTIGKLIAWTTEFFKGKGIESPRLDTEVLLAHLLERDRMYLYVHFDEPLEETELTAYREMVRRRAAHEPVAYITGVREFMGYTFHVTPSTLIPRPDTETLVEAARGVLLALYKKCNNDTKVLRIADIGTGTGAIALSLLAETIDETKCGRIEATLVDISEEALAVAKKNAENLAVAERTDFRAGDLLTPLAGERYDAILSNPPYIRADEMAELSPDVRDYEPHTALTDGGDGLSFYRRLIAEAKDCLADDGFLAVECGMGEAADIVLLAKSADWKDVEVRKDLSGIERVVIMWK